MYVIAIAISHLTTIKSILQLSIFLPWKTILDLYGNNFLTIFLNQINCTEYLKYYFNRKVDNFTMALFAYFFAFGQTQDPDIQNQLGSSFVATTFAGRQLLYAGRREYHYLTNTNVAYDSKISDKSLFSLIFGDDFQNIYSNFQNYCISSHNSQEKNS